MSDEPSKIKCLHLSCIANHPSYNRKSEANRHEKIKNLHQCINGCERCTLWGSSLVDVDYKRAPKVKEFFCTHKDCAKSFTSKPIQRNHEKNTPHKCSEGCGTCAEV